MAEERCTIQLYVKTADGWKTEPYDLHDFHYKLLPTGVAVCTYNTPKKLHALSRNQQWETFALLEHMARDENVLVALWTGAGEKAFNAGADLRDAMEVFLPEYVQENMLERNMGPQDGDYVLTNMTKAFWDFEKPSIVAVNGLAVGGGANIALVNFHDLVVCSTNARFMYPFSKLGFVPELGSSFMFPMTAGMARTKEVMFFGDWISAEKAKEMGFVNAVVPPDQLMTEAMKLAERLCIQHPAAIKYSKKIINHHVRTRLDDIMKAEQATILQSLKATGGPGKIAQHVEKRKAELETIKSKL
eukprot:TRINITY_DN22497_c0_g1_i1.p1 TRINITY_DN22497_c0_g1~~TRINITY_DN22497_c0_g1_i1.p1  ORF type:complete len:302 (-),score=74.84 TRINITY_DN22497_c0_g1_i1:141-1046(-)